MFKCIYSIIKNLLVKLDHDNVSTYSAQASFFIVLSLFPFTMILLTLIKYTPLTEAFLLAQAQEIFPDAIKPLILEIIVQLFQSSGGAMVSFSIIIAVWSASRGVLAIVKGLNSIFEVNDKRNYFIVRFISSIYTSVFLVAIIASLCLLVFGQKIYSSLEDKATVLHDIIGFILQGRLLFSICLLTLLFLVIYRALPAKKHPYLTHLPGALFSALGWIISSAGLSYYIEIFPNFSYAYGSLQTFILLMLWIYIDMYILFLGAEINIFFKREFDALFRWMKERTSRTP